MQPTADDDTLIAAVTEPTRRRLLDLLLEGGGSTVTALADDLPITGRPSASSSQSSTGPDSSRAVAADANSTGR